MLCLTPDISEEEGRFHGQLDPDAHESQQENIFRFAFHLYFWEAEEPVILWTKYMMLPLLTFTVEYLEGESYLRL